MLLDKQGNFTLERGEGGLTITYQPTGAAMILAEKELYELSEAIQAWLELLEFEAGQSSEVTKSKANIANCCKCGDIINEVNFYMATIDPNPFRYPLCNDCYYGMVESHND